MPDATNKPKRKEKEKHAPYRPSPLFVGLAAVFFIVFLLGLGWVIAPEVGIISIGPSEFELLSSQIAGTNETIAQLIEATNAAATQSTELTQVIVEATYTPTQTAINTPEATATFCQWFWKSRPDLETAATVQNALLAANIPVDSVVARAFGESYQCEGGAASDPFPAVDISLEITFSQQAQTLDDETPGNTVAAVLDVAFTTSPYPLRDREIDIVFPSADKWRLDYDSRAAYESGVIGTALWQIGLIGSLNTKSPQITATLQAAATQLTHACTMRIYQMEYEGMAARLETGLTNAGIAFESVEVRGDGEAYTCGTATPDPSLVAVMLYRPVIRLEADAWANKSDAQRSYSVAAIVAVVRNARLGQSILLRIESGYLSWERDMAYTWQKIDTGTRSDALWALGMQP